MKYQRKLNFDLNQLLCFNDEKPFKPTANASYIAPDVFNSRSKNTSSAHILNLITNSLNTKTKKRSSKSVVTEIKSPMVNDLCVSEMVYFKILSFELKLKSKLIIRNLKCFKTV